MEAKQLGRWSPNPPTATSRETIHRTIPPSEAGAVGPSPSWQWLYDFKVVNHDSESSGPGPRPVTVELQVEAGSGPVNEVLYW